MPDEEGFRIPPPSPPPFSEEDAQLQDAARQSEQIRGFFANQIFVQPSGGQLRLTFGEIINGRAVYHTSLVVPDEVALNFGKLIQEVAETSLVTRYGVDNPDSNGD
ncbi:MAG: hypothetical protein WBA51_03750 [Erythrobacter sp.]